ncbi:uncharacterized protein LOC133178299 [Saccostrea echinata]|uniref:uncharacterized protein LOC133178299 n=1 Tax=Saccostrea echinata TaxID=191078 RepID=UPI002A821014|nr:uncharacterized protein LOC133178299 [Saccostrea echinata]
MAENRKHLSNDIKKVIVDMREKRYKLQQIADDLNFPRGTVTGVISRFKQRSVVENLPQTGRPRLLSVRDSRSLVRLARTNRKTPLKEITTQFNTFRPREVSKRTVQRCLCREGYHRRIVKKKVRVKEVNRKKLLAWCRGKLYWRVNGQWDTAVSLKDQPHDNFFFYNGMEGSGLVDKISSS